MMRNYLMYALVVIAVSGLVPSLAGQDMTGSQVLDKVEDAIEATSAEILLTMELYSASGSSRQRSLQIYMKESDGRSQSLMRFTAPADVEGTAFLARETADGDEEMYLYMPVLGSVRRIAGSQKNGSFMGSDFTYNDLTILGGGNYQEDYRAEVLSAEGGEYVLRLTPTDEEIPYSAAKMWVPADNWFPTKLEFYNQEDRLHKRLVNAEIEQIDGNWTARVITMYDVTKGTRTVLTLKEIQYNAEINDRIFTTRYLQR